MSPCSITSRDVSLVQLAQIVIHSGSSYDNYLNDAAILLNNAIHIDPNEPMTHFLLGIVKILQKKHVTALAHIRAAIILDPLFEPAVNVLFALKCSTENKQKLIGEQLHLRCCSQAEPNVYCFGARSNRCFAISEEGAFIGISCRLDFERKQDSCKRAFPFALFILPVNLGQMKGKYGVVYITSCSNSLTSFEKIEIPLDYGAQESLQRIRQMTIPSTENFFQSEILFSETDVPEETGLINSWEVDVLIDKIVIPERQLTLAHVPERRKMIAFDIPLPSKLPLPFKDQIRNGFRCMPLPSHLTPNSNFCANAKMSLAILREQSTSTWLSVTAKGIDLKEFIDFSAPIDLIEDFEPVCPELLSPSPLLLLDHLPAYHLRHQFIHYKPEKGLTDVYGNDVHWSLSIASALYWRVKGDAVNALKCLRHSLNSAPPDMRDVALVSMANIYQQAGLLHSALIAGGSALKISPKLVAIHFTLANIYASLVLCDCYLTCFEEFPGAQQAEGGQDIPSSVEDVSNVQCVNYEVDTTNGDNSQQSLSSITCIAVRNGECYNQQVFAENSEVSQSELSLSISRVKERYDGVSITIPVGGTLSRSPRYKLVKPKPNGTGFKSTLRERNASMYLNEWLADVHFIVGAGNNIERIPAHSYVLAIASAPFNAMFNGGFEKSNEIELPDVEPAAFKVLLKYLYYDDIELDASNGLSTLYVAKKYMITHLARAAVDFLDFNLKAENVCLLLAQSQLFEEEQELINRCWKLVDVDAERVLASDAFCNIDFILFDQILSRNTLLIHEKLVYEAALRWAKAECERQELLVTQTNMRNVLGSALYHIRFPTMTIYEFANGPAKMGLLTCQEINDIFLHFAAEEKPQLPFLINERSGLRLFSCLRFQTALEGTNQWRYRGRCDSIQFLVDRRIYIVGYGLYGSNERNSQYKLRMELKKGDELLESKKTVLSSTGSPEPILVHFDHPVQIEPEVKHTASVTMEGKDLSFFGQEGMTEVGVVIEDEQITNADHTVNFYFTPSADSKNGTGVQGGQIPIIVFFA
uniref:BTB domain-containing protein n=1 Tax=Setaria digitata TaxID=48799 RepID=A0A915PUH9_9BILA